MYILKDNIIDIHYHTNNPISWLFRDPMREAINPFVPETLS